MPESIPQLEQLLHSKRHELNSINSAITGAGIGAFLTKGSPIGAVAGALLANDNTKKEQLEREIADINQRIQNTQAHISQLHTKQSELMSSFQNEKANADAAFNAAYNNLEQQKALTQDPQEVQRISGEIAKMQADARNQEMQHEQSHRQQLDAIQQEINSLSI